MNDLVVFLGATLALNLTPGPDMLYVIARSAGEGRSAGVVSAFGIATGCLVHTLAVTFGLSGLLLAVPAAYTAVRYLGAAYLVFLGVRRLLRPSGMAGSPTLERSGLGGVYRQGVITNVLNPKVALFFVAFLPQFVDRGAGHVALQLLGLGLLFNLSGTLVNVLVALGADRAASWSRRQPRVARWLERLTAGVFIALGLRLALARRR